MSGTSRAVGLLAVLLLSGSLYGADATWVGNINDNFWDANNWSPKDFTGVLTIVDGSPSDPIHSKDRPGYSGFRPAKLNVSAGAYLRITGGTLIPWSSDNLNGNTVIILGGLNVRSTVYIGKNASGRVTVAGGTFTQSGAMTIGYGSSGNGLLNVIGGSVYFASRPTLGASGGTGRINVSEGGWCYCPGNETTYFQGLVTSGLITTDPGCAVVVDYYSTQTRITAKKSSGAILPVPWDKTDNIGITNLSWTSDSLATSNQVYLGTDAITVLNATTSSTDVYLGSTTASTKSIPYSLTVGTTYYWRVDTVKSTGTAKGVVWSFKAISALGPRKMEDINRGVVAVYQAGTGVYVGWRMFGTDPADVAFNVYRGSTMVNFTPITDSTNYTDAGGTLSDLYSVRPVIGGVENGCSEIVSVWANQYLDIPVQQVPGDTTWSYFVNDGMVGDLDGDGQYEIIIKRLPPATGAGNIPMVEAYELDGTFMWRINMGPNFTEWEEFNPIVYDFDGDGKAEIALKTGEQTTFGDGTQIGDTDGDGLTNYSSSAVYNSRWFMTEGPEFLSIIEGQTGRELARTDYIRREPIVQWGPSNYNISQLAHRSCKFHMTPAYLDGQRPSLVICRGIYHREKMEAWNWRDGSLQKLWEWDSAGESDPNYDGQGNHNLSVGDVDQDGRDEIAYGACVIDDNGRGLYSTGLDHGDAMHLSDMDPCRPGLEIWRCLEWANGQYGHEFRDAGTGQNIIRDPATGDSGRCAAGDIDPRYRGYELWGSTGCALYSCDGTVIRSTSPSVMNFMIYWDGDLLRELLDHNWLGDPLRTGVGRIDKWDYINNVLVTQLTATGTYSCNDTKGTPTLQADILGDWREEAIWRTQDNRNIRIYTTVAPTSYRIFTLMHDPQYRLAVAWQVCGYNQPPHPGFYLGTGMTYPPASPNIVLVPNIPKPDLSGDCRVNFADFALMVESWSAAGCGYTDGWCSGADMDHNGTVNMVDTGIIASHWLECSTVNCP
jgi:rhamnogalacturonan endolyase